MTGLYIAAAIPVFFLLLAVEAVVAHRRGLRIYRFADAVSCLSCGMGQQVTGLLWNAALLALYVAVYEAAAMFSWSTSWWGTWAVAMLLVDHQYYWWHRTTHRSRLFWATHVVHHQSEDYNFAVALRQAWFSSWSSLPFQLPLAVLGIPPVVFAVSTVLNTLYQFWIHTELVGKVGPLEWVFNTPSHHRVHHGVDPRYIDRNHGGVLIVWDRLYGTFQAEEHAPTYGTVTPLRSYDPLWANFAPWVELARDLRRVPGLLDKLRYALGPPEWRPASLGGPLTIPEPEPRRRTWDPVAPGAVRAYVLAWFVVVSLVVSAALALGDGLSWGARVAVVVGVVWTTVTWSGLLEGQPWAGAVEGARLGALALAALGLTAAGVLGPGALAGALVLTGASAAGLVGAVRRAPVAVG